MSGEELIDALPRSGIKDLNSIVVMAINDAVFADPQTPQASQVPLQWLEVAGAFGQSDDGSLHPAPGFRRQRPLIIADLIGGYYLSRQGWRRAETSICLV